VETGTVALTSGLASMTATAKPATPSSDRALGAIERGARKNTFQLNGEWREVEDGANLSAIAARHRENSAHFVGDFGKFWPMCPVATDHFYFHLDGADVGVDPFALLIEELRGRTLLLLGDSLTAQFYAAMLIELATRGLAFDQTEVTHDPIVFPDDESDGTPHNPVQAMPTMVAVCPSLNMTIKAHTFYDLVTPAPFNMTVVEYFRLASWQTVDELMRGADVSITNFGIHYNMGGAADSRPWMRGYYAWGHQVQRKRYGYMLHRIREEKENNPQSCHFLRETFHQHFPGGGTGTFQKPTKVQKQLNHTEDQVHTHIQTHTHTQAHTHKHTHTHTHTHIHTHTHTHIHTHTYTQRSA
jgi:hypothetical protein